MFQLTNSATAVAIAPRYVVVTRSAQAPSSGGGKYRRPVHVRVMDRTASEWHAVRGLTPGMVGEWRNVDSRYSGPRSEYGQAMQAAREMAARMNAEDAALAAAANAEFAPAGPMDAEMRAAGRIVNAAAAV